jgi:hypothetical protein
MPRLPLLCGLLLALSSLHRHDVSARENLGVHASEALQEEQRTKFFVAHNTDKILSEGAKALSAQGVNSFDFMSEYCSWNDVDNNAVCRHHLSPPVPLEEGNNEHGLLLRLKDVCAQTMEKMSNYGSAYEVALCICIL